MKKVFLILLMTLTNFTFSQNKLGVFTGINYNYLTQGHFEGVLSENSISYHLGVVYEMKINETTSFRPKILYSQQGDRKKTEQSEFHLNSLDYKLSYINIPLEFKFWNKIYIITGPQIGYLINTEKMSNDYGDVKSDIDLGFNLGGGYTFNNYFVELSTYKGFSKIYEYENTYKDKLSLTNTLFRLSIGYNF